jgi:integrase
MRQNDPMASIRKRTWQSSGEERSAWIADYRDQAGRRHIKSFARKKDAEAWLTKARHEVAQGTHTAEAGSVTVAEAGALWLDACTANGLEPATTRRYRNHLDLHILPRIGSVKLARLSAPMVESFRDELLKSISRPLAKKVIASLKAILSDAQRRGLVAQNVASAVSVSSRGREKRKLVVGVDIPSKQEIATLLDKVDGRWRPLIVTAIFTGMRSSELRGLRWSDIDFDARLIHVRQRADETGIMGPPKSAAGDRSIPMAPMVVNALREWRMACPRGEAGLVFPNGAGRVENHSNIVARGFDPAQVAAGLVDGEGRPKYSFHALRHFFASWIIEQDFSPKRAQALLGHSSIQMTFDRYGHLFPNPDDDHARFAAGELSVLK